MKGVYEAPGLNQYSVHEGEEIQLHLFLTLSLRKCTDTFALSVALH